MGLLGYYLVSGKYIRKNPFLLLLVVNLSFFLVLFPAIVSVQGVSITYSDFWFHVNSPQEISYDEMYLTITNPNENQIQVECTYEKIIGVNISISLQWSSAVIEPNNFLRNHYSILVNESFSATYDLKIYVKTLIFDDNGSSHLGTGAIVLNRVSYYSDLDGFRLTLNALDQGDRPRESRIQLYHKINDSYSWTPIIDIFGNRLDGYFPRGIYLAIATDNDTGIVGEEQFLLANDSIIDVYLDLILFGQFTPIADNKNHLGINATVDCYLPAVYDVTIYAELFFDGEKLDTTDSQDVVIPKLEKGLGYPFKIWFDYEEWQVGEYEVFGYIYSASQLLVRKFKIVQISDVNIESKQEFDLTPFIFIGIFIAGFTIPYAIMEIRKQLEKKKLEKVVNK